MRRVLRSEAEAGSLEVTVVVGKWMSRGVDGEVERLRCGRWREHWLHTSNKGFKEICTSRQIIDCTNSSFNICRYSVMETPFFCIVSSFRDEIGIATAKATYTVQHLL